MTQNLTESMYKYKAYMEARDRIRYLEYSLRIDASILEDNIGKIDVAELAKSIHEQDLELVRLRDIRP